jgi:hypothetical protein
VTTELHPKIASVYLSFSEVLRIAKLLGLNIEDKEITSGKLEFYFEYK